MSQCAYSQLIQGVLFIKQIILAVLPKELSLFFRPRETEKSSILAVDINMLTQPSRKVRWGLARDHCLWTAVWNTRWILDQSLALAIEFGSNLHFFSGAPEIALWFFFFLHKLFVDNWMLAFCRIILASLMLQCVKC